MMALAARDDGRHTTARGGATERGSPAVDDDFRHRVELLWRVTPACVCTARRAAVGRGDVRRGGEQRYELARDMETPVVGGDRDDGRDRWRCTARSALARGAETVR